MTEQRDLIEAALTDLQRLGATLEPTPERQTIRHIVRLTSELLDRLADARLAGATAVREEARFRCCCRCRPHNRVACPVCLEVEVCPVHATPSEDQLRPNDLLDPRKIARELWDALSLSCMAWHECDPDAQDRWTEAVRRIVVVRAARR